jgi:pentatricopeptide repeat protein
MRSFSSSSEDDKSTLTMDNLMPPPPPITPLVNSFAQNINNNENSSKFVNNKAKSGYNRSKQGNKSNYNNSNNNKSTKTGYDKLTDAQIISECNRGIWKGDISKNPTAILDAFQTVKHRNLELGVREYSAVLWACEAAPLDDTRSIQAFYVYEMLLKICGGPINGTIPIECYHRVIAVCARRGEGEKALDVYQQYKNKGYPIQEKLLINTIISVAKDHRAARPNRYKTHHLMRKLKELYDEYKSTSTINNYNWKGTQAMYHYIILALNNNYLYNEALYVLQNMTESQHEPSLSLCNTLFENALLGGQMEMLTVLSRWYIDNFYVKLEYGICKRMLALAATRGDDVLAQNTIKLMKKANHPIGQSDYSCWIRACLANKKDMIGAMEALISAGADGVDMHAVPNSDSDSDSASASDSSYEDRFWGINSSWDIQKRIAENLARSVTQTDNVYFALVDLVKENYTVPPMALNAIIMASGANGKLDRAFATFSEMETLFGIEPDVNAHNALLWANGKCMIRAGGMNIPVMLQIIEKLEKKILLPNNYTFDILLKAMVEKSTKYQHHHSHKRAINSDLDNSDPGTLLEGLEQILSMVKEYNITLRPRTIRRLARATAEFNEWDITGQLLALLETDVGEENVNKFFLKQISDQWKIYQESELEENTQLYLKLDETEAASNDEDEDNANDTEELELKA